ncbi:hypothetical protein E2C01_040359 [Portunus trituberculatus]|uniref:Uncharacterized protein n=1 Tax=Portunus trituberculatus TaxID=210409 RepID=A0A5B7FQK5_PORTR|nr:hypothetical protein [Portunus trituberculatus]
MKIYYLEDAHFMKRQLGGTATRGPVTLSCTMCRMYYLTVAMLLPQHKTDALVITHMHNTKNKKRSCSQNVPSAASGQTKGPGGHNLALHWHEKISGEHIDTEHQSVAEWKGKCSIAL